MRQLMGLLQRLVPCDTVNFGTVDLDSEEGFHFSLDGFLMPPERRELLPAFKHQHPMLNYARAHGFNPPLRFTDFVTRRQFEEIPLYRECYRGYTHSMLTFGVAAPPGLNVSFVLSRAAGEFSDQERDQLTILQPLLSSILRERILQDALMTTSARGRPVGVLYGHGIHLHTGDAHGLRLLAEHYPASSRHRLPEALWSQLENAFGQTLTLRDLSGSSRLSARIGPDPEAWCLELWEESVSLPAHLLARYGLTRRQTEVLQWLARGKANSEIAFLLGISHRTVEKHLETIYRQLGVENRLAAVRFCRELGAFE
ncbi:MAG: response regulator transcription factor [Opitutales bacterium]